MVCMKLGVHVIAAAKRADDSLYQTRNYPKRARYPLTGWWLAHYSPVEKRLSGSGAILNVFSRTMWWARLPAGNSWLVSASRSLAAVASSSITLPARGGLHSASGPANLTNEAGGFLAARNELAEVTPVFLPGCGLSIGAFSPSSAVPVSRSALMTN